MLFPHLLNQNSREKSTSLHFLSGSPDYSLYEANLRNTDNFCLGSSITSSLVPPKIHLNGFSPFRITLLSWAPNFPPDPPTLAVVLPHSTILKISKLFTTEQCLRSWREILILASSIPFNYSFSQTDKLQCLQTFYIIRFSELSPF
jgi:hypothetical protein